MSTPHWTQAQQAAIRDRGGALLVSAAAGSGKTAVLTERAVQLITDPQRPVDADRLLIVTFTSAAAAELRSRIGQALLQRIRQQPGSAWLARQRMLLQRAPICTIDAFCLELLHRHFQALDIPPDFSPADPGSLEAMRQAALEETLEQACADPDFCAFADLYGKGRSDQAAGRILLQVYDFLRALPDYDRWMDRCLAPWEEPNSFEESGWQRLLLAEADRCAAAGLGLLSSALEGCQADWQTARREAQDKKTPAARQKAEQGANDKFSEAVQRLEEARTLLDRVKALAGAGQWEALYDLLTPYVLGMEPLPGLKGMKHRLSGEHKTGVRACADEAAALFERILDLVPCSLAEAEADRAAAAPKLRALFLAVREFDRRLWARKQDKKLLEFSDFEHLALRLLRKEDGSPTALCESIRAGYGAVMVDEYQDTNALQDTLYRCLAGPGGDELFLVGDLKQSIYRFRQADPSIFREKMEQWPSLPGGAARPRPDEGQSGAPAQLALDANFRSAPGLVEGINFFFEQLMSPALGDTAYGEGQRLVCGAPGDYSGGVEVRCLAGDTPEEDAAWIARKIEALVKESAPVREGSSTRPVRYEDCCILLAARKQFPVYAEALAARGIPVYADARENLMDAPHIRPLIALLRIIDNPAQDIYLASAMLGPLFGFTDDEMVQLRSARRKGSLYGAVAALAGEEDRQDPFARKIRQFYGRLAELRSLARSLPAEQLMEEIFASTGYLAALGAMENGQRRREDARKFAAFCAQAGAGGISALVRAVEAAAAAGGETGQSAAPGAARPGCVSIMTIHRSKGLQFPVVVLADTGHPFNSADTRQPILLHRVYGAGLRLRPEGGEGGLYKTAPYAALSFLQQRELRSEQMRLLYVALTRAQDRLILTLPLGITRSSNPLARAAAFLAGNAAPALHQQAGCFADWLRAALLVHPCGGPLRTLANLRELPFADTPSKITLSVQQPGEAEVTPPLPERQSAPPDPALTARLAAGFGWRYPAAALSGVPAKVSVTAVVHRTEQTTLERPAFLSKEGLTAAEKGTALHSFLEHADFAALAAAAKQGGKELDEAICAERDRQLALRLMAPELAGKLEQKRLHRFFSGEAFRKICAAEQVLREYPFITALPAGAVLAAQSGETPKDPDPLVRQARVLVQGIADLLLIFPDHLELLDYKTDRGKSAEELLSAYRPQLNLYALAIEKRFAPKKITYRGIYSFWLGRLVEA